MIYFYYDVDEWELFDRENDVNEMTNAYDDPAYAEVVKQMTSKLAELRIKYKDSKALDDYNIDRFLKVKDEPELARTRILNKIIIHLK